MVTYNTSRPNWNALSSRGLKAKKIFQAILFPVDFSAACTAMAPYVRDLAELTGGSVTLLHVIPCPSAWYGASDVHYGTDSNETLRGMKRAVLSALAAFQDRYFSGIACEKRIESGCIGEQIVDCAEHAGMDLIMIAAGGTAGSARRFACPTLTYVLRDAPCPVWIAPDCDHLRSFQGFNSIVCAVAPEEISGEYVNEALSIAGVFGSRLTFVSAVTPDVTRTEQCRVARLEEEFSGGSMGQFAAGSRLSVYIDTGPVGGVVRHVAELQSADLVIIHRRHRSDYSQVLEGRRQQIVLEAPCPVLILPAKAAAASRKIIENTYRETRYAMAGAGA
jgi:nucleotide-binding universal stress UspA family protein